MQINFFTEYEQLDKPRMTSVEDVTSNWRSEHIVSDFKLLSRVTPEALFNISQREPLVSDSPCKIDIAISYHKDDSTLAQFLLKQLQDILPNAVISLPEESQTRNTVLDESKIIVPLLSVAYVKTAELLEELNIALCKQRFSGSLVFFPVYLEALPSSPAYLRLLWSLFSCVDKVWADSTSAIIKHVDPSFSSHEKCLYVAAYMIAFVLNNPTHFQESFKTLLSIEELYECSLKLRSQKDIQVSCDNPLFFAQK